MKMEKLKIVDLFAGAGGWTTGLKAAGHEVIWAVDNWEPAIETYRAEHGNHIDKIDVMDLSSDHEKLLEADVIVGSPPCKRFSLLNKKRDYDLSLTQTFLNLTKSKPFVMENVPMVKKIVETNLNEYGGRNYLVKLKNFGVPQHRTRFVKTNILRLDGFMPEIETDISYYLPFLDKVNGMEAFPNHSKRIEEKMSEVESGTQHPDHRFGVYYRIPRSGVSQCIVNVTKAMTIHPKFNRRLRAQEAAVLQTFPVDYKFQGNIGQRAEQVGNAVPPRFAYYIGLYLKYWWCEKPSLDDIDAHRSIWEKIYKEGNQKKYNGYRNWESFK